MSEETERIVKKFFDPTTLIMAMLISILTWGSAQIVGIKEVQASMLSEQVEDRRVNEIVYTAIPDIQISITKLQESHKSLSKDIHRLINEARIARNIVESNELTEEYMRHKPLTLQDGTVVMIHEEYKNEVTK